MFAEMFFNMLFSMIYTLLDMLPFIDWELPIGAVDACLSVMEFSAFFLPLTTINTMLGIILLEEGFKILLSLAKLIWKFIPVIGN